MKTCIITLSFLMISLGLLSQDLIVTENNDSIKCNINQEGFEQIAFTYASNKVVRDSVLPKSKIKSFELGYYHNIASANIRKNKDTARCTARFYGGISRQTSEVSEYTPPEFKSYVEELKKGYHIGGDIGIFFSEKAGIGIHASRFQTSNSMDGVELSIDDIGTFYGTMSDYITIFYLGPQFYIKSEYEHVWFVVSGGLGYTSYKDVAKVDTFELTTTGENIGFNLSLGLDIKLLENLLLVAQIGYLGGTISSVEMESNEFIDSYTFDEDEEKIGLSRIDFSAGLRIIL